MRRAARVIELGVLAVCLSCRAPSRADEQPQPSPPSAASRLAAVLAPRPASEFRCQSDSCSQEYPRLPDSGEWRCAETARVVWCAGGEPAAGVAPGVGSNGYRCANRFGGGPPERICIDEHPDYPDEPRQHYRCAFAQERGVSRSCKPAPGQAASPLPRGALPACWLDKDCRAGRCDRGACGCSSAADCDVGQCRHGVCSGAP